MPGRSSFITGVAISLVQGGLCPAIAADVDIRVVGTDGEPVAGVAAFVTYEGSLASVNKSRSAVMDQRDTQFVPHVLVVPKGTAVEFPNSDIVAHHVYSFSRPNNFVLPLYKGDAHEPVTFINDGVVTLGCNIHDHMLAYIVVVDTDAYGVTNADGRLRLSIDNLPDNYQVQIWSPRIRDKQTNLQRELTVSADTEVTFALRKKLRPPHHEHTEAVAWAEY